MTVLRCHAYYQGYEGKAWEFRRSKGFTPEYGWIDLDMSQVKNIRIIGREVPWRSPNGFEINGQTDILSWSKVRQTTGAEPVDLGQPAGGGLNMFGHLVLKTIDDQTGAVVDSVTYRDVYVAYGGLEEVTKGLAQIEDHNKGTLRVPLMDIRYWFWKCGGLFSSINARMKSGEWIKGTTKDGKTTPWQLVDVVRFLFSQLPGSPAVFSGSELFSLGQAPPPSDIIGEGELAVEHLQRLLDRYGLEAGMRPDGSWTVDKKASKRFGYKEGPDANGGARSIAGIPLHYESKTTMINDRPPAVCITGPRRIRRITVPYVPVLEDVDRKIYRLEAVVKRWGMTMDQFNNIAMMGTERMGHDIPPTINASGGGRLHERRVKCARRAYRMYAPAFLFEGKAEESTTNARGISDRDFEIAPFLPMKPAPWYVSDLTSDKIPKDAGRGSGDKEEYILMPPIARGLRFGSHFLVNKDQIENYFKKLTTEYDDDIGTLSQLQAFLTAQKTKVADALVGMSSTAGGAISSSKLGKYGAAAAANLKEFDADVTKAAASVGRVLGKTTWDDLLEGGFTLIEQIRQLEEMITTAKGSEDKMREVKSQWEKRFEAFKKVYENFGGVYVRYNIPYDFLESGSYSIDLETGILQSAEPLCHVDKPLFFDGDGCTVTDHGQVTVTFGYELKDNTIAAYSSFLFVASAGSDDSPGVAKLAGVCKSSALKAQCVPMNARLYELEEGTPVNLNACYSEAWQKASAMVSQAQVTDGFVYTLSGMYHFPLAPGVTGVQHVGIGGSKGHTHLTINAPAAKVPLGPPQLPKRGAGAVDVRENIEREKEK